MAEGEESCLADLTIPPPQCCKQCTPLVQHIFKRQQAESPGEEDLDAEFISVQLHQDYQQKKQHHVCVTSVSASTFPPVTNVSHSLDDASTEFIADFYAAYIKYVESQGYTMIRAQTAALGAPVKLPVKKGDTGMDILSSYLHLPISVASKTLGICATSLKKICRKHGLVRWPHRKIKSIDHRIGRAVCLVLANIKRRVRSSKKQK